MDGSDISGTPEDQAAFVEELQTFYRERQEKFRLPIFYGKPLNLLKLWRTVIRLGGYKQVSSLKLWRQVADSFSPPMHSWNMKDTKSLVVRYISIMYLKSQNLLCLSSMILHCSPKMGSKPVEDLIEASSGIHFSRFHFESTDPSTLVVEQPTDSATENIKQPFVIDADVRLARRIRCDTVEKGRDIGMVLDQYSKFVKPALDDFILAMRKYADIIIPHGGDNHVAIDLIVQHIRTKIGQHDLCEIYPNLHVIQSTFQIRGMRTLIRDAQTTKDDFVFYSDRLIRLVVEHGLGHLPFTEKQVITPTGTVYSGIDFCKRLCGVSVIRSGESMENALHACCKGIKIGKILIHREGDNGPQLIYEKLPQDISDRHVLLLDPILGTGDSAVQAISLLIKKGVPEGNIIFLNLISAPQGVHMVCKHFPRLKIVTSEIEIGLNDDFRVIPGMGEFGDRYFWTDDD
ncbi:uridine like 4 [Perilla frutescens var. frutescens]|nr:uridine like 4 [Perilla frutescens var. frutescens]